MATFTADADYRSEETLFFVALFLSCAGLLLSATHDAIIRGGRIVDGAGNPAYFADIAVKHGKHTGENPVRLCSMLSGNGRRPPKNLHQSHRKAQ